MPHILIPQPITCPRTAFVETLAPHLPLPLGEVMARANAHYYAHRTVFGAQGDFITAPEISQIFGEVLAFWCLSQCELLGTHTPTIVECGPGRGTLMADMLRMFQKIPTFQPHIILLENSPSRQEEQKQTLQTCPYPLFWCAHIDAVSQHMHHTSPLIIIGNEFLDALPTQPYIYKNGIWHRVDVALVDTSHDTFTLSYAHTPMDVMLDVLPTDPHEGAVHEHSPMRTTWIRKAHDLVRAYTGALCFIDYGDDVDVRFGDTFQALKAHTYVHPLAHLGACDLTTHVDFRALCRSVPGATITTQRAFLMAYGYTKRLDKIMASCKSLKDAASLKGAAQRLIDPQQMGSLFKVWEARV